MILVTGCTGYIGSRLTLALLEAGKAVRGLVLSNEIPSAARLVDAGMQIWKGDLFAPETLRGIGKGVTTVYHMAGLHSASLQRMEALYIEGTRHLMQACADAPLRACVIASNGAVYGDGGDEWLTEQGVPCPTHPFGKITLQMERLLLKAHEETSFPSIILRIAQVYGPGKYNPLKGLRTGRVLLLGDGTNWTSRIHIDDLLTVLMLAPTQLSPGEIYNVADDFPIRQRDFYNDLTTRLDTSPAEWIPLNMVHERVRLSIHGLRALSLRLTNDAITSSLRLRLRYPTYREGIDALLAASDLT